MEFLLMFFQIALEHKWFSAVLTCECPVVCMHAEMLKYILLLSEFLVAILVLALEGGWVSVCLAVEDFFEIVPLSWNAVKSFHLFLLNRIFDLRGWVSAVGSLGMAARNLQLSAGLARYVLFTFRACVVAWTAARLFCHHLKKQCISSIVANAALGIWGAASLFKLWVVLNGLQPSEILNRLWNNPGRFHHHWNSETHNWSRLRLVI